MKLLTEYQKLKQIKGIEKDWPTKPEFLPFEKAREFVHSLNLKSQKEWNKYYKSDKKPDNIPTNPTRTYKNDWTNWGDWLGTGNAHKKEFLPFKEAREFARSLELKKGSKWFKYCKSGNKPDNIPTCPNEVYKDTGWISMGDWLGTRYVACQNREHLSFEKAREFARSLNLKSKTEWEKYSKSSKKPDNIPADPREKYKNCGWINWGDWLGTGSIANQNRKFLPFEEARKFVHSLHLKSRTEWVEYCKSDKKPDNVPVAPNHVYKDSGWNGFGDWLGTGTVANQNRKFLPFKEAREFVRSLNFKSQTEWKKYCKSEKRPDNIPADPQKTYKNSGWVNWSYWLGK